MFDNINQYLTTEGYEYVNFEGELVYKKGKGIAAGPTFFKLFVNHETVILEAWIKFAALPGVYAGELGIDGFYGWAQKAVLKTRVEYVETLIMHYGGVPLGAFIGQQPQQQWQPQQPSQPQQQWQPQQPSQPQQQWQPQQSSQPQQQWQPQQSPVQNTAPAFCSQCGNKLAPGAKFCNQCGAKVQ